LTEEQGHVYELLIALLDGMFNHQNWASVRRLSASQRPRGGLRSNSANASLDDPFTRLLKPEQYHSLKVPGELTGVGLQIALNPKTEQLEV